MPKILIVSPCFQPVNTPDLHRVRLSIPWFIKAGWTVTVLAVQPQYIEAMVDPTLEFIPDPCRVIRVKAFSVRITRKFGLGNLGYRSWLQLKKAGNKILTTEKFDIIYFSTTVFPVMTLGRVWKKRFNIPFVLDMQDPWRNDFYLTQPKHNRPPKYKIAHFLDTLLEKWTIPHCDGIIAVSESYPVTLNQRYGRKIPSSVITFAASENDFETVQKSNHANPIFKRDSNTITLLYTGAVTPGMPLPLEATLIAVKKYITQPDSKKIRIFFIGTSYSDSGAPDFRVIPLVKKLNLEHIVFEQPARIGYFDTLRLLMDADALLLPGSIEAGYTASKIYPYILSKKPIFALTHSQSSVSKILIGCKAGKIITFNTVVDMTNKQLEVDLSLQEFIDSLPFSTDIDWEYYKPFSEESMANKQITFFDTILSEK